ncbi:MAG TPA: hypothetical protein VKE74_08265, partial [Gemmataceae bacterium]|nr:hypothetical protein [Gemmataceae bacterium]
MSGRGLIVLAFCAFPTVLALPNGVYWTAMGIEDSIEDGIPAHRLWLGLPLLLVGILVPELFWRALVRLCADPEYLDRVAGGDERERKGLEGLLQVAPTMLTIALVLLQFITLMQFLLMLDMHVRFR